MSSLQQGTLNFNKSYSFNFEGGNLSSDAGLIMVRSFIEKLGIKPLLQEAFNDCVYRQHTYAEIIEQLIFSIIAGYPTDNAANSLRYDPVFTRILGKESLASQPTISRFVNALDERAIVEFNPLMETLFELGNPPKKTRQIVLDLDSTLFEIFGKQEQGAYNFHYDAKGYHPLMLFNGLNGDLMKVELRGGSVYTSKDIGAFLEPVLKWLEVKYPNAKILVRADSGFATPELYDLCNTFGVEFVVKLKANATLKKYADDLLETFTEAYGTDYSKHHVMYDEFTYQAKSWQSPQRVICRAERAASEFFSRVTFVVTTLKAEPSTPRKAHHWTNIFRYQPCFLYRNRYPYRCAKS